jgi:hypothetical protein
VDRGDRQRRRFRRPGVHEFRSATVRVTKLLHDRGPNPATGGGLLRERSSRKKVKQAAMIFGSRTLIDHVNFERIAVVSAST